MFTHPRSNCGGGILDKKRTHVRSCEKETNILGGREQKKKMIIAWLQKCKHPFKLIFRSNYHIPVINEVILIRVLDILFVLTTEDILKEHTMHIRDLINERY